MIQNLNATCQVLYVEDTPEDQRMLMESISLAGVSVAIQAVATSEIALKWLSTNTEFHVLLVDWNLPAMPAVELLRCARSIRPNLPFLVVTGEPKTVDAAAAKEFGVDKIISKPLDLDQWEELARDLAGYCEDVRAAAT